ncbi:hypothetical protein DFH07DRAFT_771411 [Mycena maculata]|uniref:Uncharacterized protein n=1 Tax=Mycena maculata TaxID=230809 RepID=A0AAD7NHZ7_9AGAR|nr:hypothetical protein DFH07DRAFT_771411 [Mycena maculata]
MAQIVSGAKIACGVCALKIVTGVENLSLSTSYKQGWRPKQPFQKLLRLGLDSDEVIRERKGNGAALAELFFARSTLGSSGAKSLNTQHAYACYKDVTGLCGVLSPIRTVYALVFGGTSSFITDPFCSGSNSERDANTEHDTANDGDHKDGTKTQQRPGPGEPSGKGICQAVTHFEDPYRQNENELRIRKLMHPLYGLAMTFKDTTYFQARPFGPEGLVLDLVVDASGYIFHSNTQAGGNRHGSAVDNFSRGRKVRATVTS